MGSGERLHPVFLHLQLQNRSYICSVRVYLEREGAGGEEQPGHQDCEPRNVFTCSCNTGGASNQFIYITLTEEERCKEELDIRVVNLTDFSEGKL